MSLNIKHKRSSVNGSAPTPAQLEDGELAVNYNDADPALYIKDSAGAVVRIAGDGAPGGGEWDRTGTELSPKTAGDDVFTSGDVKVGGTTGSPNIGLNADGSAEFVGIVRSDNHLYVGSSPNIQLFNNGSSKFGGTLSVGTSTSSADQTIELNANGSATFASTTTVGAMSTGSTTSSGVRLGLGYTYIQRPAGSNSVVQRIYQGSTVTHETFADGNVLIGGTLPSAPNISLKADGSAKFETATDFTPDSTGALEIRSSDTSVQAGTENTNLLRFAAGTSNGTTAALIAVGKYEDSSFGRGELTIKVPDTSLSANLKEFKFRGDGKALLPGDVLIGGTLPSAPNISLNASGDVGLVGDITNTTVDGDQDIICNGAGLIKLTEYNLNPMEVVTKHDIGTGANEVPVNGFLGTLAYQDDLAIQDGTTVALLPTSPTARVGNITRVTDGAAALTWGATVTGGGTAQYLVWYNGTNWTVFGA